MPVFPDVQRGSILQCDISNVSCSEIVVRGWNHSTRQGTQAFESVGCILEVMNADKYYGGNRDSME